MKLDEKIEKIQSQLVKQGFDGWLLYDNHGTNRIIKELLEIPPEIVLSRRFFYWIPSKGVPEKILHCIEEKNLEFLPGKKRIYLSWKELEKQLKDLLSPQKKILMEYSPRNSNPYISMVDAGTLEVVRGFGSEVFSSQDLLQCFTSVLSKEQIASHEEASRVLEQTASSVWNLISDRLRKKQSLTEYEVQNFMKQQFASQNCFAEEGPICAVNANSSLPHYMATEKSHSEIRPGDFILIDLWCKKKSPFSVYADITRVAIAGSVASPKQKDVFNAVKLAQEKTVEFIQKCVREKKALKGCDVDDVCRKVINEKGYGSYFTHRTGHSIDVQVHGTGAHFDNLETNDERKVLSGMCFSIEPGIYLPNEFGVRLESNILIEENDARVTDQMQKELVFLL